MNSEAEKIVLRRQKEINEFGVDGKRRHALQTLKLKTVIKESHCTAVAALAFNSVDEECANIFATVGKDQATIYDDFHMGDYIGVVVQYVNAETEHSQGGELRACTWLNSQQWCRHPQGDACLAVAGLDTNVSIISIVESRVTLQLKGHTKEVVDLAACTGVPNLLASLSKDGELRLWDAPNETCTACVSTDATSLALSPDGKRLATGGRKGGLRVWSVPQTLSPGTVAAQKTQKKKAKQTVLGEMESQVLKPGGSASHLETVDCVQFLDDTRLISKSADGRIIVTNLTNSQQLASWKVPNCSPSGGLEERCRFSTTTDGSIVCAGNSKGEVYAYETASGSKLAHVASIKVAAPVRACGLSEDCRHLLGAMGNGFIFRFEAVPENSAAAEEGSSEEEAAAVEE